MDNTRVRYVPPLLVHRFPTCSSSIWHSSRVDDDRYVYLVHYVNYIYSKQKHQAFRVGYIYSNLGVSGSNIPPGPCLRVGRIACGDPSHKPPTPNTTIAVLRRCTMGRTLGHWLINVLFGRQHCIVYGCGSQVSSNLHTCAGPSHSSIPVRTFEHRCSAAGYRMT